MNMYFVNSIHVYMFALILKQKLNALRPEYQVTDHQDALHPSNQSKNRSQDNLPGKNYIIFHCVYNKIIQGIFSRSFRNLKTCVKT